MPEVGNILSKNGVPEAKERRVIADIVRMMEVVVLSGGRKRNQTVGAPRELVATVAVQGLEDTDDNPNHKSAEVHVFAQDHGTN
jgi:hypothetical protein